MTFLERLADDVSSAVARSARIIARWTLRRISDLFSIYRTLIVFVPLVYTGAFGHEFTYSDASLPRFFGWSVVLAIVGFIAWSIYELVRRLFFNTRDYEDAPLVWIGCSFLAVVMILGLLNVHHQFRSPILAKTQSLPTEIRNALLNNDHDLANLGHAKDQWLRFNSTGSLAENGETHLSLWVEGVHSTNVETILDVACKTWRDSESAILADASGAYLIDQSGHKFDLKEDLGDYSFFLGERKIVGGEIYRWPLVFPRIGADTARLKLKHPRFQEININFSSANIQVRFNASEFPTQGPDCDPGHPWIYTYDISLKETNGIGVNLSRILVDTSPFSTDKLGLPKRLGGSAEAKGQVRFCVADNDGFDSTVMVEGVDDKGVLGSWIGTTRLPGTRKEAKE